jgi:hypothetical protein
LAITVDRVGLKRMWRARDCSSLVVSVSSARRSPDWSHDPDLLRRAVAAANADGEAREAAHGRPLVWANDVIEGPAGPVLMLDIAEDWRAIEQWLDFFASHVEVAGWDGKLRPQSFVWSPVTSPMQVAVTAVLCVSGWSDRPGQMRARPAWETDDDMRRAITDWAVRWVCADAAADELIFLSHYATSFAWPRHTVQKRLRESPTSSQVIRSPDPGHARCVTFDRTGRVIVQARHVDDWARSLAAVREAVVSQASWCELAWIRVAKAPELSTVATLTTMPPRIRSAFENGPVGYYSDRRHLDHQRVPDACGIQLLTEDHLALAHDLRAWNVTDLGGGKHLVEAVDTGPWFEGSGPEADVLDRARRDFGAMILTSEPPLRTG